MVVVSLSFHIPESKHVINGYYSYTSNAFTDKPRGIYIFSINLQNRSITNLTL